MVQAHFRQPPAPAAKKHVLLANKAPTPHSLAPTILIHVWCASAGRGRRYWAARLLQTASSVQQEHFRLLWALPTQAPALPAQQACMVSARGLPLLQCAQHVLPALTLHALDLHLMTIV